MQSGDRPSGRLFEDLSKLAGGALGAAGGLKADLEALVRTQAARLVDELDLVRRDEFEAARERAAKAREAEATMAARLAELEARLAALEGNAGSKGRSTPVSPQESSDSSVES
ncbi:MAG: accessory factor UbiK family protein, partial [Alphaproteobacteria bacterium]